MSVVMGLHKYVYGPLDVPVCDRFVFVSVCLFGSLGILLRMYLYVYVMWVSVSVCLCKNVIQ